ncbi:hypothetical protein FAVG1_12759 [Fusarium avenaceum]|nr:hypothetical protein FAVG1_12759 [Fusarium avenaceum]
MPIYMEKLNYHDRRYQEHKNKFYNSWWHPNKTADVKSIFLASKANIDKAYRGKCFNTYLNGGQYKRLYHGAQRTCRIGESGNSLQLCHDDKCSMCGILRTSFKLKFAHKKGMFGPGIYSTPCSSKADIYAKNHHVSSRLHAMLICHVVASKPDRKYASDHSITQPGAGYNCVEGVTITDGGALMYPEYIVYREDAIIPVGLVIYSRKGWEPPV